MKTIEGKNAKKDYHAPKLQDYGNIQQITASDLYSRGSDSTRGSKRT
jgi:hypothetical protein